MHAGEREWFGNVPDKLSHTAFCGVLIAYTAEVNPGGGEPMSGVASIRPVGSTGRGGGASRVCGAPLSIR